MKYINDTFVIRKEMRHCAELTAYGASFQSPLHCYRIGGDEFTFFCVIAIRNLYLYER
jgi:hypothetical protein